MSDEFYSLVMLTDQGMAEFWWSGMYWSDWLFEYEYEENQ